MTVDAPAIMADRIWRAVLYVLVTERWHTRSPPRSTAFRVAEHEGEFGVAEHEGEQDSQHQLARHDAAGWRPLAERISE
jgi:hypothetical protein